MQLRVAVTIALLVAAVPLAPLLAADPQEAAEHDGQQAAESWLALVDAAKYGDSWSSSAVIFQKAVTQEKWRRAAQAQRQPLGRVKTRKFKTATYSTSLPGAPDGEYVVTQYETEFEQRASAIEKVTSLREADGRWRVAGYYVK